MAPERFVLDVDGVMTTGQFLYSAAGKMFKVFGPHDSDGLAMVSKHMPVEFVSADHRGFAITRARIERDMGYPLRVSPAAKRFELLDGLHDIERIAYMGDGFHDAPILLRAAFGVAPASGRIEARNAADFVTNSSSGNGAVMDACLEIIRRYFPGTVGG